MQVVARRKTDIDDTVRLGVKAVIGGYWIQIDYTIKSRTAPPAVAAVKRRGINYLCE